MWTVVYIAPSKAMAEMLKEILVKEGLLCMLKSLGIPHAGDAASFEILVPEGEAEEAHEILAGVLGG
ncbi:MAG: glutamate decarboxylase [Ignavibacteriales bacterium]